MKKNVRLTIAVLAMSVIGLAGGIFTAGPALADPECEEEYNFCPSVMSGNCDLGTWMSCKETLMGCANYSQCNPE